jgi:hypothetical protein
MAFFRMIKGDSRMLTMGLLFIGAVLAFYTILDRIEKADSKYAGQRADFSFKIDKVSFITFKQSSAKARLKLPSKPEFSDDFKEAPYVDVKWKVFTRGDEIYEGNSRGTMKPPYDYFVFSIQEELQNQLKKVHTEELIITEYRMRIIYDIVKLELEIYHPETRELLESYIQTYEPETRRVKNWLME